MALMKFTVDVLHTDRTKTGGTFTTFRSRVTVLAADHIDAQLMAAQLVSAVRDHIGMVIGTAVVL